ncbi:hypothetical protein [Bacillus sp. MRMR6]|uniref:hypothetical protein n=1 Tax=Bacillus sp. MRMR6 TaxID=1928617 RepID=UPI000952A128|nr:hypothetical protein [Bacillus sp. MRMR6]OLS35838.1 hypothetical protein BTR25_19045 [Bacillus sp. MRMR6]
MFVVHFIENKNVLLSQLLQRVPSLGENITIKGKKGKVSSVSAIDEKHFHVELIIEKVVNKSKVAVDNSKKKKR